MTTDPQSTRKALKKTATTAIGEKVPGVATVLAAFDACRRKKWEERFESFTIQIMAHLDKDPLSLQLWIEQNGEEDWLVDGFEQGFRVLMETMDEAARKCALVMIAHYLQKAIAPDRVYRQFGDFFQQADLRVLEMTEKMSEAAFKIAEGEATTFYVTAITHRQNKDHVSYNLFTAGSARSRAIDVQGVKDSVLFRDTCDVLLRTGLLSNHGSTINNTGEIPWGKAEVHQIRMWKMLHGFLTPIRELSLQRQPRSDD